PARGERDVLAHALFRHLPKLRQVDQLEQAVVHARCELLIRGIGAVIRNLLRSLRLFIERLGLLGLPAQAVQQRHHDLLKIPRTRASAPLLPASAAAGCSLLPNQPCRVWESSLYARASGLRGA